MSDHDHSAVERYYDATWYDYRGFWMRPRDRAIHFGFWDSSVSDHSSSLLRMNQILAERAGISRGARVYDAGCGVGGSAFWLAEHLRATVVGVNIVGDQVVRARRYATDRNLQGLTQFLQGDYTQTNLPSGTFDVAWVLESLCHAEDKPAVLEECFRLLVPGGVVVIAEYLRVTRILPAASEALLQEWLSGWAIPDVATEGEICAWLQSVGFGDVSVDDITAQVRPSVRRLNRLCLLMTPVMTPFGTALTHLATPGRLWKPLRVTPARLTNVAASRAQWKALRRNLWFYSIITARKAIEV